MSKSLASGYFKVGEEFGSVIGSSVLEHPKDGVQQFARNGHQGLKLGLMPYLQMQIEGFQMSIEANSD